MNYVKVRGGEIVSYGLPKTGVLKTGETVSNYHMLPEETLLEEGWLPLEEAPAEYDKKTQYISGASYEILESKVIKRYTIANIILQKQPVDDEKPFSPEERIAQLEAQVQKLLMKRGE